MSDSTDVVIPATVSQNSSGEWIEGNTYTVTAIADGGYNSGVFYNSGITSVTFPSSLTSIGIRAFYFCDGLTSVDLSGCTSLTSIGNSAFQNCSGLTSVSLPSSLTSIGIQAFFSCSGLTGELNLGGCTSLTSIGNQAFDGCNNLTEVIIDSPDIYKDATSTSACGRLFNNTSITTVKVLTSLVEAGENSYISTNFPNVSNEPIGEKNYTVYSK